MCNILVLGLCLQIWRTGYKHNLLYFTNTEQMLYIYAYMHICIYTYIITIIKTIENVLDFLKKKTNILYCRYIRYKLTIIIINSLHKH